VTIILVGVSCQFANLAFFLKRTSGSSSFKPHIIDRRGTLWLTTDSISLEYVMRLTSSGWFRQFLKHSTDRRFVVMTGVVTVCLKNLEVLSNE